MARTDQTDDTNEDGAEVPPEDQGVEFTSWEFQQTPTTEDVHDKLRTLPDWWGLRPEDYIEFIQPLSQSKNFAQPGQPKNYRTVWTLYVTVAGRIRMINDAASNDDHMWTVNFVPEPHTPTGIPGMLQFDGDRIVYREYVEILGADGGLLGRKPGTAWVPASGGGGAVASNRFEKVETSARGRAIAAWGFGVLPGSGVASLDEMLSLSEVRQATRQQGQGRQQQQPRQSREEIEDDLRMKIVEFQQVSGSTDDQMKARVVEYVQRSFSKDIGVLPTGAWDFDVLKTGEVVLFRNRMADEVRRIKNEQGL